MVYEIAYLLAGAALLAFASKADDESPYIPMAFWGTNLVLVGIGFISISVPDYSFLPMGVPISFILFKGSRGAIKPLFFLLAAFFYISPLRFGFGTYLIDPGLLVMGLVVLTTVAIFLGSFKGTPYGTPIVQPLTTRYMSNYSSS